MGNDEVCLSFNISDVGKHLSIYRDRGIIQRGWRGEQQTEPAMAAARPNRVGPSDCLNSKVPSCRSYCD
jgi:hypothetical protein